ncbi:hypothetical protein ZHAS_00016071 [Anopheles sinensis]|uniref:Uncharacterized protein n=1 Tax=Anopheles sinensis TaxID=74873 RepID=A0A084WD03_ANOSI|nr:hypothetical protein ZHAS_00016071 [Anopheles sinensis]
MALSEDPLSRVQSDGEKPHRPPVVVIQPMQPKQLPSCQIVDRANQPDYSQKR